MKKILLLFFAIFTASTCALADEVTFDFSAQGYTNAQDFDGKTTDLGSGISVAWSKGTGSTTPKYYTSGTAMRLYGSNTATFTSTNNITKIVCTFSSTSYTGTISASCGSYSLSSATGTWTGSATSVTLTNTATSGHSRLQKVVITYEAGANKCSAPELTAGGVFTTSTYDVIITNKESGSTVYYTTDGNDPTTSSESFTDATKTLSISETTTVKAMSVLSGKDNSSVTSATYTYEKSIANTAETAYTVAQIKDIIDAGSAQLKTTELFVKGKVSQVDSYNSTYGSITYWISDDGETTSQQFEIYGGLSFEGAKFAAISEIQVGDDVIVKGLATFYASKSIYEFNQNSTLIYRTEHSKKTPTLTATYQTKLNVGETDNVVVSYDGDGTVTVESSNPDVADVDSGEGSTTYIGAYAEGTTTITISAPETDNYYAASLTYTLNVVTPIGGLETFTNGGFETWSSDSYATGWKSSTTASSATVSKSTDARTGNYSAKVTGVTSSNKRLASKEFKLAAGYYTFLAHAKAANADENPRVAAGFVGCTANADGSYTASSSYNYGSYATVDNSTWTAISKTIYLDKDTVVNLVIMNNKTPGKDVLIDDAEFREATAEEIDQMTGVATFEYTPSEMAENSVYYYESEDPTTTPSVTWKSGNRFTFSTYTAVYGTYKYYYSYAVSNKTTTDGKLSDYALESACGGAKNGKNYAVWYDNSYNGGSKITLESAGTITGFYVSNTTSAVDAIINGDGMSTVAGGFQNGDYFTLTVKGYDVNGDETGTVDYKLAYAEEGTIYYVKDWRWVDLTSLGSVASIEMTMTGSKTNTFGLTTPTYFCMDDLGGTKPETDANYATASAATGISSVNANAAANLDGKFIQNGRMVIVKDGKTYNTAGQAIR